MAKKPPPPKPEKAKPARSARTKITVWLLLLGPPLILLFMPTWVFLFLAMLPAGVAFLVDRTPYRFAWISVAGMNFAGVAPFLMNLWFTGNRMEVAFKMLADVFDLLIMYGAAGFGWIIHMSLPPIVGAFLDVSAQHRLSSLKATQQKLTKEWGEEVGAAAAEAAAAAAASAAQIKRASG
jgi:hypothetical protein